MLLTNLSISCWHPALLKVCGNNPILRLSSQLYIYIYRYKYTRITTARIVVNSFLKL